MMEGVEKEVNVLIVEDDKYISNFICMSLKQEGYHYLKADTGREAIGLSYANNPDVVILDLGLPDMDGMEVIEHIRSNSDKPIIVVSARQEETEKIKALDLGADDYVVKPFELEVLYSRVRALLRRAGNVPEQYLSCDSVRLDQNRMMVFCGEEEITLSQSEYQLLLLLIRNKGKTVTRERILQQLWDSNGSYVNDNTLTVTMKRLREKLHNPSCIKTIRSFGYRMEDTL